MESPSSGAPALVCLDDHGVDSGGSRSCSSASVAGVMASGSLSGLVEGPSCCSELPSNGAPALVSLGDHGVDSGGYRFCSSASVAGVMTPGSV